MIETVRHPQHYGGDSAYEVVKVIDAWGLGFNLGNAVKYVARAGKKPGVDPIEDLEKARFYLELEIEKRKRLNPRPDRDMLPLQAKHGDR